MERRDKPNLKRTDDNCKYDTEHHYEYSAANCSL